MSCSGHQLTQKFQPLCYQLTRQKIDTRQVATRPGEARDKTKPDWIFADVEDYGDSRSCSLGCQCRSGAVGRNDRGHRPAHQLGQQFRQPIELTLRPAVFDRNVVTLNVASVLQALTKCAQTIRVCVRRCGVKELKPRHCRLLRPRRVRPYCRRAAEQRNELATLHSITSSARASSVAGTVIPS